MEEIKSRGDLWSPLCLTKKSFLLKIDNLGIAKGDEFK